MKHIERLTQEIARNHKRDVGFAGALRAGYDTDAAAPERAEELAGDTRRMLHVSPHDGDSGKAALHMHGKHGTLLDLFSKLTVEHRDSLGGILIAHTDRCGVLR